MCQCGCGEGDYRFRLKAPRGHYVLTFCGACDDCEVGPSVTIEHLVGERAAYVKEDATFMELGDGPRFLRLGPNRPEFVAAMIPNLRELGDEDGEQLGRDGAEVYAEEAWIEGVSALLRPRLVGSDDATDDGEAAPGGGEGL